MKKTGGKKMNLKTKSKILSIITKILAFILILFFIYIFICYLPKNSFLSCSLSFIVLFFLCELTLILLDGIFDENYFYEHLLKATSEETLLKKGFEYMVAPLYFDFYIEAIEVDGKKINYSGDKKKFKNFLKENDKVTAFCRLETKEHWSFHYLSDDKNKASHEQLISDQGTDQFIKQIDWLRNTKHIPVFLFSETKQCMQ